MCCHKNILKSFVLKAYIIFFVPAYVCCIISWNKINLTLKGPEQSWKIAESTVVLENFNRSTQLRKWFASAILAETSHLAHISCWNFAIIYVCTRVCGAHMSACTSVEGVGLNEPLPGSQMWRYGVGEKVTYFSVECSSLKIFNEKTSTDCPTFAASTTSRVSCRTAPYVHIVPSATRHLPNTYAYIRMYMLRW